MTYELKPCYENQKSFYGKAEVIDTPTSKILKSYGTTVAEICKTSDKFFIYNCQSNTTVRHINEFLQQSGFPKMTMSEMRKVMI
jgi:hypothetical protein